MFNSKKYISLILSIIFSALLIIPFGANATPITSVDELKAKGTCYSELGDDTLKGIMKGDYILTEIEERMGNAADYENARLADGDIVVKNCFRVVGCKGMEDKKQKCTSFLNSKCEIASNQKLRTETKVNPDDPGTVTMQDLTKTSCKKMQLIVSKGGTTLLYGYIGMIYKWVASLVGIVSVLIMVFSGIQISAAGGDAAAVDEAKGRIFNALGGLAVLFFSGLILYTINPTFFVQ